MAQELSVRALLTSPSEISLGLFSCIVARKIGGQPREKPSGMRTVLHKHIERLVAASCGGRCWRLQSYHSLRFSMTRCSTRPWRPYEISFCQISAESISRSLKGLHRWYHCRTSAASLHHLQYQFKVMLSWFLFIDRQWKSEYHVVTSWRNANLNCGRAFAARQHKN